MLTGPPPKFHGTRDILAPAGRFILFIVGDTLIVVGSRIPPCTGAGASRRRPEVALNSLTVQPLVR